MTAAILLLYWTAMTCIPVPGYGAGVLTKQGCLQTYIDQLLLPGRFSERCYGPGDSVGILSTLPSIGSLLLGVLAGHCLRSSASGQRKTVGLVIAGLSSLLVGHLWGRFFPINKHLWTSSYVLVAGGWCALLLALFYWVIDVKGYKKWAFFFIVIGMNPITIYFLQRIVNFGEIAGLFVKGLAEHAGTVEPMVLPVGVLLVKWLFLWFLYRHKLFFKI